MKLITTTIQGENPITRESVPHWIKDRDDLEQQVVNVYPQITFQRFDGFGGAVTQASAWVLMQMPADVRARILAASDRTVSLTPGAVSPSTAVIFLQDIIARMMILPMRIW